PGRRDLAEVVMPEPRREERPQRNGEEDADEGDRPPDGKARAVDLRGGGQPRKGQSESQGQPSGGQAMHCAITVSGLLAAGSCRGEGAATALPPRTSATAPRW